MGSIINAKRNTGELYNHFKCETGEGNLAFSGWGVRDRAGSPGLKGNSFLCKANTLAPGATIKYLRFRLAATSTTPDSDHITLGIYRRAIDDGKMVGNYLGYSDPITIDKALLVKNGYTNGFEADVDYCIELPEKIYLQPTTTEKYYIAFHPHGLKLDYDTDGTEDGCSYGNPPAELVGLRQIDPARLADCNYAISFEVFSEPDEWVRLLEGGSVEIENAAWQDSAYCTTGGPTGWTDEEHIYDGLGDAVSVSNGDYIDIDLGAGHSSMPPGWDPQSEHAKQYFPDYTVYGVRALTRIVIAGEIVTGSAITVSIHDHDFATPPSVGWQPIASFSAVGVLDETISVPQIARWVRITETGAGGTMINDFNVHQIAYRVTDGRFYSDMANSPHPNWVGNYPGTDRMYRVVAGNMAGGESKPSKPITNRMNLD